MQYDKICLMLPTCGRSKTYLPRFIDTALKTAEDQSRIEFMFCVNDRDQETRSYLDARDFQQSQHTVVIEHLPTPHLAKYFNMMYGHVRLKNAPGTIVTEMGDDMEFRTSGWDSIMLALINHHKGVGVFWANDDYIAHERCPVNMFVSQDFVEATGHPFMCEMFSGDMIDWIWGKVGKFTRTSHYAPDVHIWHNHSTAKPKEQWDPTFQKLYIEQQKARAIGKDAARSVARQIADVLIRKGLVGDSVC